MSADIKDTHVLELSRPGFATYVMKYHNSTVADFHDAQKAILSGLIELGDKKAAARASGSSQPAAAPADATTKATEKATNTLKFSRPNFAEYELKYHNSTADDFHEMEKAVSKSLTDLGDKKAAEKPAAT